MAHGPLAHDALVATTRARPDAPAVIDSAGVHDRAEVLGLARGVAAALGRAGVRRGDLVGVVHEAGVRQVAAVVGVLLAGAAYVPVDPAAPAARRRDLLAGTVGVVLTRGALTDGTPPGATVVDLDEPLPAATGAPRTRAEPDDLAVVLHTSGSTGRPKGVMVPHRGIVHALEQTALRFPIESSDRSLAVTALHHDMSMFDLFGVLGAGGAVVVPDPDRPRDAGHWADLVRRHGVTLWTSVPTMLEMLAEQDLAAVARLRRVFLGGDRIPLSLVRTVARRCPDTAVVSVGGPTETTLWNIWFEVDRIDPAWTSVPYGRPLPGTVYHLLDEALREVGPGEVAEMYCAGVGVTAGYLHQPELTAARYPTHPRTGERLFRTGDLGRRGPDGVIEFVGRGDDQVQIGGHRVEPGEIEAVLLAHPDVDAAVVVPARHDAHRRVRGLRAWIRPRAGARPDPRALREHVAASLPRHMVPEEVRLRTTFPLSVNGKVDRGALERDGDVTLDDLDAVLEARLAGDRG